MLSMPILCLIGQEVWRVKESKSPESQSPGWGPEKERAIMWEITTAVSMLHAGGDIVVLRHPKAALEVKKTIDELMKKG
jgi:acetyl-CoA decarbonylase/synthase complex subunit delta